ncbi:MAG: dUTP diphosphatase [Chitinophagaceae bacterium]|nr:dUTP diphosphatase [Chitinophagaceae bacterium]MCW5927662.1 dUTP diphosphatase [Chitinophagaceae bacterium]
MPDIINIKVINKSANPLPEYATNGASGMDVRADITEPLALGSLQHVLVPTGLFMEIPEGFEVQVRPRSGLAAKQGITVLNAPGTIDADYRGEVKVILVNLSSESQTIQPGDRIAQLVVQKVEKAGWEPVHEIGVTTRNDGGFGHTGKN